MYMKTNSGPVTQLRIILYVYGASSALAHTHTYTHKKCTHLIAFAAGRRGTRLDSLPQDASSYERLDWGKMFSQPWRGVTRHGAVCLQFARTCLHKLVYLRGAAGVAVGLYECLCQCLVGNADVRRRLQFVCRAGDTVFVRTGVCVFVCACAECGNENVNGPKDCICECLCDMPD